MSERYVLRSLIVSSQNVVKDVKQLKFTFKCLRKLNQLGIMLLRKLIIGQTFCCANLGQLILYRRLSK